MNGKLIKNVMLDLGVDINLLPTGRWKQLGYPPLELTQYNISLANGSLVWYLGLLGDMLIYFLRITSVVTFDMIDMANTENLKYIILLDLEWFIDINRIINNKTQDLFLSNDDYQVYILLKKYMSSAYIKA